MAKNEVVVINQSNTKVQLECTQLSFIPLLTCCLFTYVICLQFLIYDHLNDDRDDDDDALKRKMHSLQCTDFQHQLKPHVIVSVDDWERTNERQREREMQSFDWGAHITIDKYGDCLYRQLYGHSEERNFHLTPHTQQYSVKGQEKGIGQRIFRV